MKRLPAAFYQSASGREPVREWLRLLPEADRKIVGEDIKDVEFSWPIGMPALPGFRKRLVGSPERARGQSYRAGAVLCSRRPDGFVERFYQKDTEDTPGRI